MISWSKKVMNNQHTLLIFLLSLFNIIAYSEILTALRVQENNSLRNDVLKYALHVCLIQVP